jgi:hypothetical protein|tara:strand:+ start:418 stop:756 length:339 start_codon:yes stop_codon:yes gene_type:complete
MLHKVKKTNGKLELHVTLVSMLEAESDKGLSKRVNSQKAKELLMQLGHSPGNQLNDLGELRNDVHDRTTDGIFIFEDLSAKKVVAKPPAATKSPKPAPAPKTPANKNKVKEG